MSSTYLELTNKLLRKLNEVELNYDNFDSARGVHATCKDAINDAIGEINSACFTWPFNAYEHTQTLIPGTSEYGWPDNLKLVDWNSFQIQKNDTLGADHNQSTPKIDRDYWYKYLRDKDEDAGTDGLDIPSAVFEAHGQGFGVTPVPDKSYDIKYRYYIFPAPLVLYTDETTIPLEWEFVIFQGALWHGSLFKEDPQAVQLTDKKFKDMIDRMRTILVNRNEDMRASRYNTGYSGKLRKTSFF